MESHQPQKQEVAATQRACIAATRGPWQTSSTSSHQTTLEGLCADSSNARKTTQERGGLALGSLGSAMVSWLNLPGDFPSQPWAMAPPVQYPQDMTQGHTHLRGTRTSGAHTPQGQPGVKGQHHRPPSTSMPPRRLVSVPSDTGMSVKGFGIPSPSPSHPHPHPHPASAVSYRWPHGRQNGFQWTARMLHTKLHGCHISIDNAV